MRVALRQTVRQHPVGLRPRIPITRPSSLAASSTREPRTAAPCVALATPCVAPTTPLTNHPSLIIPSRLSSQADMPSQPLG